MEEGDVQSANLLRRRRGVALIIQLGLGRERPDSLLSRTLKRKNITLKGVNSAYLYFGMWRSLFAWHTEDLDL